MSLALLGMYLHPAMTAYVPPFDGRGDLSGVGLELELIFVSIRLRSMVSHLQERRRTACLGQNARRESIGLEFTVDLMGARGA